MGRAESGSPNGRTLDRLDVTLRSGRCPGLGSRARTREKNSRALSLVPYGIRWRRGGLSSTMVGAGFLEEGAARCKQKRKIRDYQTIHY